MTICRFLLLPLLFCLTTPLFSQKDNFVIGIQSGINLSRTIIQKEFNTSALNSDYFIGSSFGVIARSRVAQFKWSFASLSEHFNVYLEYGLNAMYSGYNYRYENQYTFQEQLTYSIPLLIVMRGNSQRVGFRTKYKDKRMYTIAKVGLQLNSTPGKVIQKDYTFGETLLQENVVVDQKANLSFVGAFGVQKELKNGRIVYLGFSAQTSFSPRTSGTITVDSPQINEIAKISKPGNIYSIDLQYFLSSSAAKARRAQRKDKRNKSRKLPKIIYNPRF